MNRQMLLALGCLMLLAGWMSAFLYRSLPQSSDIYYLVPTLLLAVGMGLVLKIVSGRLTAVVLALTAVASIMAVNAFYPSKGLTLLGIQKKMQSVKIGNPLTMQVREADRADLFSEELKLESFADIEINLFTQTPGPARMLAFDSVGNLLVSIPKLDAIYLFRDKDRDGYSDQAQLFSVNLDRPHGLVWQQDRLYVAETARLLELRDTDGDMKADQSRVILEGLPDDGGHWTRSLAMGADGLLYLSVGSRCNACEEQDKRRATILRVNPATGHSEVHATGLRNSVGLVFDAEGQNLWASDNGRDSLGEDLPPDEINRIVAGGNYGWPYCFGAQRPDPELANQAVCRETLSSAVDLQAHSAPLGIVFGDQLAAPLEYRNSLFVAYHGSWNRRVPTGYKLVRIPFVNGQPAGKAEEFLSGWLVDGQAWGRPVAPVVGPDGALYLSDDRANAIYRIRWKTQE
ncbi:MAG TPA: PQQ-dependent sugar dehydrogenase [Malonomonas sp.]